MSDRSFIRPVRIPGKRFVITKKIIEDAISNTNSNSAAARWIGVTYNTYKKWSKYYGLFENNLNQSGKGINKKSTRYKVNIEDEPEISNRFGVMSIPATAMIRKNGQTESSVGSMTTDQLKYWLDGLNS